MVSKLSIMITVILINSPGGDCVGIEYSLTLVFEQVAFWSKSWLIDGDSG